MTDQPNHNMLDRRRLLKGAGAALAIGAVTPTLFPGIGLAAPALTAYVFRAPGLGVTEGQTLTGSQTWTAMFSPPEVVDRIEWRVDGRLISTTRGGSNTFAYDTTVLHNEDQHTITTTLIRNDGGADKVVAARFRTANPEPIMAPASIDPTGATDVTAPLAWWLFTQSRQGRTVKLQPNARYRVEGSLFFEGDLAIWDLTVDGNGATLFRDTMVPHSQRYPQRHGFIRLGNGCRNLTFRNLHIEDINRNDGSLEQYYDGRYVATDPETAVDGVRGRKWVGDGYLLDNPRNGADNPKTQVKKHVDLRDGSRYGGGVDADWGIYCVALEFNHGWDIFDGAHHILVEDCNVDGVFGDFVCILGNATNNITFRGTDSTDVRSNPGSSSQVWDRAGRQGFAVSGGHDILLENTGLFHSFRAGVDLETDKDSHVADHMTVRNCELLPGLLTVASQGAGPVNNVLISRNLSHGRISPLVQVTPSTRIQRQNWVIEDNVFTTTQYATAPGFAIYNVTNAAIRRNVVPFLSNVNATSYPMIPVAVSWGSTDVRVYDNWFKHGHPDVVVEDYLWNDKGAVAPGGPDSTWEQWNNQTNPAGPMPTPSGD